jgi:hypothetical protein
MGLSEDQLRVWTSLSDEERLSVQACIKSLILEDDRYENALDQNKAGVALGLCFPLIGAIIEELQESHALYSVVAQVVGNLPQENAIVWNREGEKADEGRELVIDEIVSSEEYKNAENLEAKMVVFRERLDVAIMRQTGLIIAEEAGFARRCEEELAKRVEFDAQELQKKFELEQAALAAAKKTAAEDALQMRKDVFGLLNQKDRNGRNAMDRIVLGLTSEHQSKWNSLPESERVSLIKKNANQAFFSENCQKLKTAQEKADYIEAAASAVVAGIISKK